MKLALLLISCLVGVSYEQGFGFWPVPNRALFYPNVFQDAVVHDGNLDVAEEVIEARVPAWRKQQQLSERRLFFLGQLLTSSTSTVISTQKSTVTVVSVANCIPKGYFNGDAKGTCGSTRKRQIEEDQLVSPSQVVQLEASVQAQNVFKRSASMQQPVVVSSLEDSDRDHGEDQLQQASVRLPRQNRFLLPSGAVVTVTSTSTSYTFTTTTIKNALSLYALQANGKPSVPADEFTCIPSGFVVC